MVSLTILINDPHEVVDPKGLFVASRTIIFTNIQSAIDHCSQSIADFANEIHDRMEFEIEKAKKSGADVVDFEQVEMFCKVYSSEDLSGYWKKVEKKDE